VLGRFSINWRAIFVTSISENFWTTSNDDCVCKMMIL
jgi:hypothetical protein